MSQMSKKPTQSDIHRREAWSVLAAAAVAVVGFPLAMVVLLALPLLLP